MRFSRFGQAFSESCGILQLMDDLGTAAERDVIMLGGGNPAGIDAVTRRFRARAQQILDQPGEFERVVGRYDGACGDERFIRAVAGLLEREFGWPVGPENIAITNGSQSAFYALFNMFAGKFEDGVDRRILLPLSPEYIGYSELGTGTDLFRGLRPQIDLLADGQFKYRVDFGSLDIGDDIGAVCVSRPTNPTGNVLTDDEIETLLTLCRGKDIPLIVDGAYGTPFPNIIFTEATPYWSEQVILCLSLSKLGIPGVRTGIVVAAPQVIRKLAGVTAVLNLSTGSYGQSLALEMVRSGDIVKISNDIVKPYYRQRVEHFADYLGKRLEGLPSRIHRPEGAIFIWLWNRDIPVHSQAMYERLKERDVFVIAGHHFFPGVDTGGWAHSGECLRISYAQPDAVVHKGLDILAEEIHRAYEESGGLSAMA